LNNFSLCLAAEVKKFGIDVNAVCFGVVDTPMQHEISRGKLPPRMMRSEEAAASLVFLASDESSAVTGSIVEAYGIGNQLFRWDT
jgi:NAD(P)-dependent dehydrogenase (short-subunit alcohol dehydrogenase family)